MTASPPLAEPAHRARAERHMVIGKALEEAGDEWASVPLFYAAYHVVKAAFLVDPIWNDAARRAAKNVALTPDDKFVTRHHARKHAGAGREWGINELVMLLYPQIVSQYERLHQASIQVRYGAGLPPKAMPSLRVDIDYIWTQSSAGTLVS